MKTIRTSIIPERQFFGCTGDSNEFNYRAICIFVCTGFFLGEDTYFQNLIVLQPFSEYDFDEYDYVSKSRQYWGWHNSPREISLKQATEEFAEVFERVSHDKLRSKKVILPLSGGLDSRTQAVALGQDVDVSSYSYKFANSFDETKYGREIAKLRSFHFQEYTISDGYLWNVVDKLSEINGCYADFTHPRQMAVIDRIKDLGDIFYLGHWGDVLFDDSGIDSHQTFRELVCFVKKKITKKGGMELAQSLWKAWGIEGDFDEYFTNRVTELLAAIKIDDQNARVRAFKSIYWAPRWTAANLNVFSNYASMVLPYFSDEMCKFICTVPEEHLTGRTIQIEYIKMKDPTIAKIPWQDYDPFNLYDFRKFRSNRALPGRLIKKGKRIFDKIVLGKKITTRNWEIQFKGEKNDIQLRKYLFDNKKFLEFIPKKLVEEFYKKFKYEDDVFFSHPVSMLLTLSLFSNRMSKGKI